MKRNRIEVLIIMLIVMAVAVIAKADSGLVPETVRAASKKIQSAVLNEEVTVSIYLPAGYHQLEGRYPTLYVLEDDLYHRAMTGIIDTRARLGSIPEMIVIGIGTSDRWRDFTPTHAGVPGHDVIPSSGGGSNHKKFLAEELIPLVDRELRTQPFRMLFGHSVAGLHAVTTMFSELELFRACVATSPSLWWDNEKAISMAEQALKSTTGRTGSLFLAIGNEDETMQAPLRRFRDMLAEEAPEDLRWTLIVYPEANHPEVPLAAFSAGLSFVFAGWSLPDSVMELGLGAVDGHYKMLSERLGYRIDVPEGVLNRLGYIAMNAGDINGAISIFRRNVMTYPGSANVHDSLGEAYLKLGDTDKALSQYQKALELDPDNSRIRSIVEELSK